MGTDKKRENSAEHSSTKSSDDFSLRETSSIQTPNTDNGSEIQDKPDNRNGQKPTPLQFSRIIRRYLESSTLLGLRSFGDRPLALYERYGILAPLLNLWKYHTKKWISNERKLIFPLFTLEHRLIFGSLFLLLFYSAGNNIMLAIGESESSIIMMSEVRTPIKSIPFPGNSNNIFIQLHTVYYKNMSSSLEP